MTGIKNSLGKQIKKYRIAKDLSQEQLAEKIGIAVNNYGKIERGQNFVTAETLEKIVKTLEVSPRDLFDFMPEKTAVEMKKELVQAIKNPKYQELLYKFLKMIY